MLGVLNALQNGRLGAGWSGRVPSRLVSDFPSFVSQFFSFVSQAGACGRVPGWLVSRFLSFVSHFFSLVSQFFHLSPTLVVGLSIRLGAGWSGRVPGWLVSHFLSFVSHFFSFVSQFFSFVSDFFSFVSQFFSFVPGRVPGWLVSHFLSFVSHFFSLVSQFFSFVSQAWVLAVGFPAVLSPASFHLSPLLPSSGLLCPPNPFHLSPCVCICLPAPDCCGRLCLAILCLPALDVAGSSCRVFRFRKTQTVWGLRWCNLKKEGVKEKGCVGQKKDSPFTKPRSQLARRGASPIVVALLGFHVSRHFFLRSGETAQKQGTAETLRPHADC